MIPISKKIDTINESTQKVGDVINESNSDNKDIIVTPSTLLQDIFKSLTETPNSLKLNKDKDDNLSILGVPIRSLGGDKIHVFENILSTLNTLSLIS